MLSAFLERAAATGAEVVPGAAIEPRFLQGARYAAGRAAALLRPATAAQAARLLQLAVEAGQPIVLQGAHTGLVQAATPAGEVVLSTDRLRGVFDVDPLDRVLRVSSGFRLSEVNRRLAGHELCFPIDLGADPSIGGMVSHNTGGTRMLRYGDVRASTLALEVALADGCLLRLGRGLAKDNAQLALQHLFVGASGCLGLVTEVTLRVQPVPRQSAVALVAPVATDAVWPLYSRWSSEFGALLSAFEGISRPALEAARLVRGGPAPFAALPDYALLVELSSELSPRRLDVGALLAEALETAFESGQVTDAAFGTDLWGLRHAIGEGLRSRGQVIGFDISLPRARLWAFRQQAIEWLAGEFPQVELCDFGHLGDGGQHFNLVWPSDVGTPPAAAIARLRAGVYALVERYAGSFSAEHGLGPLLQKTYEDYTTPDVRRLSRQVKALLDPGGVLGRFHFD